MVNNLDILKYRPRHITQTDEPVWDDCTICSMYMAVIAATLGEVITKGPNWKEMTKAEIKKYREHIRKQTGKPEGGLTQMEVTKAMRKDWTWLPKVPQYGNGLREKWEDMMQGLLSGYCYVVAGNPSQVKNANSAYRRWTKNDDFGHAVFYERARKMANGKREIFLMDPLGRGKGFVGQWVPENQAKQFQWYDSKGFVKASKFQKGQWSIAGLAEKEKNKQTARANEATAKVAALTSQVNSLSSAIEQERGKVADLGVKLSSANESLSREQNRVQQLEAELLECQNRPVGEDTSELVSQLQAAQERVATLEELLSACEERYGKQDSIIQQIIRFLTGK